MAPAKAQRKIAAAAGRTTKGTTKTVKNSITMHYKVCKSHATSAKSNKTSNFAASINKNSSPFVIIPYKLEKSFATAPRLGKSFVANVSLKSSPSVAIPDRSYTEKHQKTLEPELDSDSDSFAAKLSIPKTISSIVNTSLEPLICTSPISYIKSLSSASRTDKSADSEKHFVGAEIDSEAFATEDDLIIESEVEDFLTNTPSKSSSTFDFSKPLATTFPEPLILVSPTPSVKSPLASPITSTKVTLANKVTKDKKRENLTHCSLQRLARKGGLKELTERKSPLSFPLSISIPSHSSSFPNPMLHTSHPLTEKRIQLTTS
jgi:hypothetical protein